MDSDVLSGDEGDDEAEGNEGDDNVSEGPGNDSLLGGPGDDRIGGADGNDNLFGGSGKDILTGGKGKDYFSCGLGEDNISDLNATEGDSKSYNCEGQQDIKAQSNINQSEQCSAKVQSLMQRAQDAIDSGEYGQWRSKVINEIQQLDKEYPEQMQGQ
jgi:Ca2+-binding RTX toxin-like protein